MAATDVSVPVTCADRAAYLPAADALVLADPHLGRGAASAVDAPVDDAADVVARLRTLLDRFSPGTVVVAGDVLHAFGHVPQGVRDRLDALVDAVEAADAAFVVTPGNHDTALDDAFDGETPTAHRLADGETVVLHGHESPPVDAERYVIGHDHPAIAVDGRKRPCFLYGPGCHDGADVLVLPAFTPLARGTTINRRRADDLDSPLVTDLGAFHPGVETPDGETLWFPPLAACRHLL